MPSRSLPTTSKAFFPLVGNSFGFIAVLTLSCFLPAAQYPTWPDMRGSRRCLVRPSCVLPDHAPRRRRKFSTLDFLVAAILNSRFQNAHELFVSIRISQYPSVFLGDLVGCKSDPPVEPITQLSDFIRARKWFACTLLVILRHLDE